MLDSFVARIELALAANEQTMFAQLAHLEHRLEATEESVRERIESWLGNEDPRLLMVRLDDLRGRLQRVDAQIDLPSHRLQRLEDQHDILDESLDELRDRLDTIYGALNELIREVEQLRGTRPAASADSAGHSLLDD